MRVWFTTATLAIVWTICAYRECINDIYNASDDFLICWCEFI